MFNNIKLNLIINTIDVEGFFISNYKLIFLLVIIIVSVISIYSTYFNTKNICPKCKSVKDLSRIKKNTIFNTLGLSNFFKKYVCANCHNKFYVFGKVLPK
jgi:transposase-like protein